MCDIVNAHPELPELEKAWDDVRMAHSLFVEKQEKMVKTSEKKMLAMLAKKEKELLAYANKKGEETHAYADERLKAFAEAHADKENDKHVQKNHDRKNRRNA